MTMCNEPSPSQDDEADRTVTLCAVGDLAFVRQVQAALDRGEDPIAPVADLLRADLTIANLETPLVEAAAIDPSRGTFKSSASQAGPIVARWFDGFNLANNHTMDCGREGLAETRACLQSHGLAYFGAGDHLEEAGRPWIVERNGLTIGMIGFSQPELDAATPISPGVNPLRIGHVLRRVESLAEQADVVVVHLHEGFEFHDHPRPAFVALCRAVVEAGAHLVLGHHPHVPQGMERWPTQTPNRSGLILYSVGNFLFDMPYHHGYPWTRIGPVATFTLTPRGAADVRFRFVRLTEAGVLQPVDEATDRDAQAHLQAISAPLAHPNQLAQLSGGDVEDVVRTILDAFFQLGQRNDRPGFEHLLRQTRRDPYLKAFHDYARRLAGDAPLQPRDLPAREEVPA